MKPTYSSLDTEANTFSYYLIGYAPTAAQRKLYGQAAKELPSDTTCAVTLRHPALLPYLDAYDAFFRPSSNLRQRLYLMFSILEASPEHTELFIPRRHSTWYMVSIGFYGVRSIYRLLVGFAVVKARGW